MYKSFKDMAFWQEAMSVAKQIFKFTEKLPRKEDYGFTSQIRRSALSISANIAEAYGRNHTSDKINFYYFAGGSVAETQSHLEYGRQVRYLNEKEVKDLDTRLGKLYGDSNKITVFLKSQSLPLPFYFT